MTNQRAALDAQAVEIKDETEIAANTATRVGTHLQSMASSALLVAQPAPATFYIDGDNGNDTNDGTQAEPVRTIKGLCDLIGTRCLFDTWVYFSPATEPYSIDDLIHLPEVVARWLVFDGGDNFEEVVGETAVTSHTGRSIDCSGASPGWVADAYLGLFVELINPDDTIMGYATIAENTTDGIEFLSPKQADLAAGGKIRIVRPGVKFKSTRQDGTSLIQDVIQGGPNRFWFGRSTGGIVWRNIEFAADPGRYQTYYFGGSHYFVGFLVSGDAAGYGQTVRFVNATVWAGGWDTRYGKTLGLDENESVGWGFSTRDENSIPGIVFIYDSLWQGGIVTGAVVAHGSNSSVNLEEGFRVLGNSAYGNSGGVDGWFGAAFISTSGAEIDLDDNDGANNGPVYRSFGDAVADGFMAGNAGSVRLGAGGNIEHKGSGRLGLVRYQGVAVISDVQVDATNGSGLELEAIYGGMGRLSAGGGGTDYSWLGDCTISQVNPLTRPSTDGAWAINESVADKAASFSDLPKDGGSAIFRTS